MDFPCSPRLPDVDKPTAAFDVMVQDGILCRINAVRAQLTMTITCISHDTAVIAELVDRVGVMYLGKIVELGPAERIVQTPLHPYTQALISSVPVPDPTYHRQPGEIKGDVAAPIAPPARCRFYPRCPRGDRQCEESSHPPLGELQPGHFVACCKVSPATKG